MAINMDQINKPLKPPYSSAKEALLPKICRFCHQYMEIKQINLTEAVRQCYKCSTPFQHLRLDDIEFFHRSYRDVNKNPADWSLAVSSEEEELFQLQSWISQLTLRVSKYEDSSDDDVPDHISEELSKLAPNKLISQSDDSPVDDLVKELQESVTSSNTEPQCGWNSAAMDELEAALERVSNEKSSSNSLPFSFDEFFLPEHRQQETDHQIDSIATGVCSKSHLNACDTMIENRPTEETAPLELDPETEGPVVCHENFASRHTGSDCGVSMDETTKMDTSHSKECTVAPETEDRHSGLKSRIFPSRSKLDETIKTGECVEMSNAVASSCTAVHEDLDVKEEFVGESKMPQRHADVKEQSVNGCKTPERQTFAQRKNVSTFETPNSGVSKGFHTSFPMMDPNSNKENDTVTEMPPAVTEEIVRDFTVIGTGQDGSVLISLDPSGIMLPFSSGIMQLTASSVLSDHQPSEKNVYEHICKCDDEDLQLPSLPNAENDETCIPLKLPDISISSLKDKDIVDDFDGELYPIPCDLEKVMFSPMMIRSKRKSNFKTSEKLETSESNSSMNIEEFANGEHINHATDSILVTVPADSDITSDMLESSFFNDMPIFIEGLDGTVVPACSEKLADLQLKTAPHQGSNDAQMVISDKAQTDMQCAGIATIKILDSERLIESRVDNDTATRNTNELGLTYNTVCENTHVQSIDGGEPRKQTNFEHVQPSCIGTGQIENLNSSEQSVPYNTESTQIVNIGAQLAGGVVFGEDNYTICSQSALLDMDSEVDFNNLSDPVTVSGANDVQYDSYGSPHVPENVPQSKSRNLTSSSVSGDDTFSHFTIDQSLRFNSTLLEDDEELKSFTGAKFTPLSRRKVPIKDKLDSEPKYVNLLHVIQNEVRKKQPPRKRKGIFPTE